MSIFERKILERHIRRVRGEVIWVVGHKLVEFVLTYLLLKVLTVMLGVEQYGKYTLVLTGIMLLTSMLHTPVGKPFLRHFHTATAEGTLRDAARLMLKWQLLTTIAIVLIAAALSVPLGELLDLGPAMIVVGGIVYLTDRWRSFAIELYDVERDRRTAAILNLGSLAVRLGVMALLIRLFGQHAMYALIGYAIASAIFAIWGNLPQISKLMAGPSTPDATLGRLIWTFGLPFTFVLVFQWVQGFSDRYIVAWQLDIGAAGLYAAAFQVTGIPFMLLLSIVQTLIVPIAYQRARNITDPAQLRSADRVLLAGAAGYVVLGALALPVYAMAGQWLMRTLTSPEFVISGTILFTLAAARWLQNFGLLLQNFFAVHHAMTQSLLLRSVGAAITVPICWYATARWGMIGAAGGVFVASLVYVVAVIFAPGGCLALVRRSGGVTVADEGLGPDDSTQP
jgi:O-antigen/teichoic acid export membrane protein